MVCSVAGCGGNPTTLASGQDNPFWIATSASVGKVFWTTSTTVVFAMK